MRLRRSQGPSWLVCLVVLFAFLADVSGTSSAGWEIDETARVTRIVDGDTFIADPGGRVRLADIDAPETDEPGAAVATELLSSLVHLKWVYLDLDDLDGRDVYGRLVAVAYVRHNATHLLNVNQALLDAAAVEARDFSNEFDPKMWTRYVLHNDPPYETEDIPLEVWVLGAGFVVMEGYFFSTLLLSWRADGRARRAR